MAKKLYQQCIVMVYRPENEAPFFEKLENNFIEVDGKKEYVAPVELTEAEAEAENANTSQNGLQYILIN